MPRPTKGVDHVDALEGDPIILWRLKVILATLTGQMLVDEACDELDVGPTQFANLRRQALQGALDALEPRPGGRPRKAAADPTVELTALRARNAELERQLAEMRTRVELAILPFLRRGADGGSPGGGRREPAAKRTRRNGKKPGG